MDVQPDNQSVDKLFSGTVYHIDFYQRDYKWTEVPVRRLLDDLFFPFNKAYDENKALDPSKETIVAKYPWYYLNTYVTNTIEGRVFVVDGQQRLTTLLIMDYAWNSKNSVLAKGNLNFNYKSKISFNVSFLYIFLVFFIFLFLRINCY